MSENGFIPEFGPNGAVLNAPGMTLEFQRELETGGSWLSTLRTMGFPFLMGLIGATLILVGSWMIEQQWIALRDVCVGGGGFVCGWWVFALVQGLDKWARLPVAGECGQKPPVVWRRAMDAVDFGGTAALGVWLFWSVWKIVAAGEPIPSGEPLFMFILATSLGVCGVRLASIYIRREVKRRGWATVASADA